MGTAETNDGSSLVQEMQERSARMNAEPEPQPRDENGKFAPKGEPSLADKDLAARESYDTRSDEILKSLLGGEETEETTGQGGEALSEEAQDPQKGRPESAESGTPASKDHERAVAALRRSGFKQSEIEGMDAQEVLDRGLERAEFFRSQDDLIRRAQSEEKSDGKAAEAPTADELTAQSREQIAEKLRPFTDAIEDEDAASTLVDVITGLVSRLDQHDQRAAQTAQEKETSVFLAARDRLRERFTDLSDDSRLDALRSRMNVLASDFRDMPGTMEQKVEALMESSARSLGWHETVPEPKPAPEVVSVDGLKDSGSPDTQRVTDPPPSPVKPEDRADVVLNMLYRGATEDEVQKTVGRW